MSNIFIFRRDFRLYDNTSLINCIKDNKTIPIFIFTKDQVEKNKYFSEKSFEFLLESLEYLNIELKKYNSKINLYYGNESEIIQNILKNNKINKIYSNKDWTPYAKKRDLNLEKICKKNNIDCIFCEDYTLLKMGLILTKSETVYKVFTPFFNTSKKYWKDISKPKNISKNKNIFNSIKNNKYSIKISDMKKYIKNNNNNKKVSGGRNNALKILSKIKNQKKYNNNRNILTYTTTLLSAYLKFGCISIREVFYEFKKHLSNNNDLFKQLFWREFYQYIVHFHPNTLQKQITRNHNSDFQNRFSKMKWKNNPSEFKAWKKGLTGFPIVDAGIRELLQTGYMHNRSRLISSSFLIKLCLIDWRKGEKYFAQNLIDYDPIQNNGGWQFHHGGASNADYFRILSPISQGERFDKNTEYIKKWIPELKDIPSKHLLDWEKYCEEYNVKELGYVKPIFNYKKRREYSLSIYKKSLN